MEPGDPLAAARKLVEPQRNYLRNPLRPGRDVCPVCRGPKPPAESLCERCAHHRAECGGLLADAVVPMSYAIAYHNDLSQHSWTLYTYKSQRARSAEGARRLRALFDVFIRTHAPCLARLLGGRPSHYAIVPSSSGRAVHPLRGIARLEGLEHLETSVSNSYRAQQSPRVFTPDAFEPLRRDLVGARVLVVDDTWTTGNTAQALAHRLKTAGAASVVVLLFGRWADYRRKSWRLLVDRRKNDVFDLRTCGFE